MILNLLIRCISLNRSNSSGIIKYNKGFCCKWIFLLIPLFLFLEAGAQQTSYDDIPIQLRVQGIGGFEIDALYNYEKNQLLLPVETLFRILRIKHEVSFYQDTIVGFVVDENRPYMIDYLSQIIRFGTTAYYLNQGDLIKTETGLYLDHNLFGKYFNLYCTFNFRGLSVELKTDIELPAIREIRLNQMRRNIDQLKSELPVDTTFGRNYHLFRYGMIDWALSSTQSTYFKEDTRLLFSTGAEVFGGETNLLLNLSTHEGFNHRNQHYIWRWANNDTKFFRQLRMGRINAPSTATLFDPLIGFSATNSPTTFRRSFGEYTISDYTGPGWTVELYINNVIVDFQTADASGFYSFDVPLVFGNSQVILKFYGPYGEERTSQQYINIPYNFLPKGELEYNITGGILLGKDRALFGRAEINYGLNRFISFGGGHEFLSSIVNGEHIPFIIASVTPMQNLLIRCEYAAGVRSRATVSYRFPSNLLFEIDYTNYVPGQKAVFYNYLEERKATISVPLRWKFLKGFSKMSFKQNVYQILTYNSADMTLSTFLGPVNTSISAYANWIDNKTPFMYANLAGGIRFGRGFVFRPQSQIDITNQNIISIKGEIEKRISRSGYFSLSTEENFRSGYRSIDFSFRWDLPFAQSNFSARYTGQDIITSQGMRGSVAFGTGNGYVHSDNRSTVGRGGLTLIPFIDVNHNGTKDKNEPLAKGLKIRINSGRVILNRKDSLIRIVELEPYTSFLVELDENSLEQIAWRLKYKSFRVYVDPNQFKKIEIPIFPMGEANGWVFITDEISARGQGRINVNLFSINGNRVASVMTEPDGKFTYLGLPPGNYYAEVDSQQIERLRFSRQPERIAFEIKPNEFGDIVDGIDFNLSKVSDSKMKSGSQNFSIGEAKNLQSNEIEEHNNAEIQTIDFSVQVGAFRHEKNAIKLANELSGLISFKVNISFEDEFFKVRVGSFQTYDEAVSAGKVIQNKGFRTIIVPLK